MKDKHHHDPEPTYIRSDGLEFTQRQLANEISKLAEEIGYGGSVLLDYVSETPYHDPLVAKSLAEVHQRMMSADATLSLLIALLMQDKESKKKKEKTKKEIHEEQEALVDGWKDDIKKAWEKDPCDTKQQKWPKYWEWIKTFFIVGNPFFGVEGWLDQADALVKDIKDEKERERLRKKMIDLGRKIGPEWAKSDKCRKVASTPDPKRPNLKDWGKKLEKAKEDDKGDGKEIEKALNEIEKAFDDAMK